MNTRMRPVIFDGGFEGFLCVVYAYYYDKIIPSHIQREDEYQEALDGEPYWILILNQGCAYTKNETFNPK